MAVLGLKYDQLVKRLQYSALGEIASSTSGYVPFSQQLPIGVMGVLFRERAQQLGIDVTPGKSQPNIGTGSPQDLVAGVSATVRQAQSFAGRVSTVLGSFEYDNIKDFYSYAENIKSFGPQARRGPTGFGLLREFKLPAFQPPVEKNVFGETIPAGSFVSGPGIKKLDISGLRQVGALDISYSREPLAIGVQDRVPLGDIAAPAPGSKKRATGLTFAQRQGLADVQTEALSRIAPIQSPLQSVGVTSYETLSPIEAPSVSYGEAARSYASYVSKLPDIAAQSARATTSTVLSKRGIGAAPSTGVFELDVAADIAAIPYRQEVATQNWATRNMAARSRTAFGETIGELVSKSFNVQAAFEYPVEPAVFNVPSLPDYSIRKLNLGGPISTRSYSLPSSLNLPRLLPR